MRIDFCGDGTGRKISLWYFGALLVLFSFLVRYFSYVWDPVISRDGILYLQAARQLADGVLPENRPELFYISPLFIRLLGQYAAWGWKVETAGALTNIIAGAVIPVIIWAIARAFGMKNKWAVWCGVLAAVHPTLVAVSYELQRESLYLLFCLLAILCAAMACGRRAAWLWGGAGILTAAGTLCRYEALELVILFCAGIGCACFLKCCSLREALKNLSFYFLGCVFGGILFFCLLDLSAGDFLNYITGKVQAVFRI
mgnify:FL=1